MEKEIKLDEFELNFNYFFKWNFVFSKLPKF